MIRLFVVARSAVVRAGLEALARQRETFELAGSSGTVPSQPIEADVILADDGGGEWAVELPLVLLGDGGPEWTLEALRSGARAALPRDASAAEIAAAVEAAAAGLVAVPAGAVATLARARPSERQDEGPVQPLTPREIEVLRMLAEGFGNKTIAWKLKISEHTVKFHVASIFTKLNAGTRTEAVTAGVRRGLILV